MPSYFDLVVRDLPNSCFDLALVKNILLSDEYFQRILSFHEQLNGKKKKKKKGNLLVLVSYLTPLYTDDFLDFPCFITIYGSFPLIVPLLLKLYKGRTSPV